MPDKWELATKKLFDLTEAGNLKWARQDDFVVRGDVQVQGFVYSATVNDKLIVVYEERVPGWEDEPDYHRSVIEFAEMVPDTEKFVTEWRWPGTIRRPAR